MRWYDKIETPKTGKTFLEEGINRLPKTDPKVSNYFAALPFGYSRDFNQEGYPILIEIPCVNTNGTPNEQGLKVDELERDLAGSLYQYYKEVNGEYIRDTLKIEEELANQMAIDYKCIQVEAINKATIKISTGKVFDADEVSLKRLTSAEVVARITGQTEVKWRLHDNSELMITLAELQEALVLVLKNVSILIGVNQ